MPATPVRPLPSFSWRTFLVRATILVVVGVIFGWVYAWASPRLFPSERRAGFGYGLAHGALMPMALPSLVLGHEVEIYAANNSGRSYKLGYIVGINLCGLVFFGSAFWRPAKRGTLGAGAHINQPR